MGTIRYTFKQAKAFKIGRAQPIRAIILHSTDGHEAGDVATLTGGAVSVHWYVTRAGRYYHFVADADTAYHAGKVDDYARHGNAATIGIEQEHIDHQQAWPDSLVKATARLVAALRQKNGNLPVLAHAEVARPKGRKEDPAGFPWARLHDAVVEAMQESWTFQAE